MNIKSLTTPMTGLTESVERSLNGNYLMDTPSKKRNPIRVLLVDDSVLALHGLKMFLSKHSQIDVVGVARSRVEALAAIQTHSPHVVVLEVRVGQTDGIDLCRVIRESHPGIGILFFTAHDDKNLLHSAILAGAQGYLLKTAAADAVARSIEIVATGEAIMDQHLTEQVITWVRDGGWAEQARRQKSCSKDDLELLSLVATGKTNKEIALDLNVTPSVVAARLQKIYKRLRISRRSEAARYYVHLGKDTHGSADPSH
jgi:two-component system, NarL family, response regulator DevR